MVTNETIVIYQNKVQRRNATLISMTAFSLHSKTNSNSHAMHRKNCTEFNSQQSCSSKASTIPRTSPHVKKSISMVKLASILLIEERYFCGRWRALNVNWLLTCEVSQVALLCQASHLPAMKPIVQLQNGVRCYKNVLDLFESCEAVVRNVFRILFWLHPNVPLFLNTTPLDHKR